MAKGVKKIFDINEYESVIGTDSSFDGVYQRDNHISKKLGIRVYKLYLEHSIEVVSKIVNKSEKSIKNYLVKNKLL